jgi:hypothetical protein
VSHEASAWAFAQTGIGAGPKFLLVALANYADKSGVCYPGRAALAKDCECRVETVTANMAKLVEAGLVVKKERRRKDGDRRRTSDYTVLAPLALDRGGMVDADPEEVPDAIAALARRGSGEESSPVDDAGVQVGISGRQEPSVEPSVSIPSGSSMAGQGEQQALVPVDPKCERVYVKLAEIATAKKVAKPKRETVAKLIAEFDGLDHDKVLRELEFFLIDGKGARRTKVNVGQTYRTFLTNAVKYAAKDVVRDGAPRKGSEEDPSFVLLRATRLGMEGKHDEAAVWAEKYRVMTGAAS